VKEAFGSGFVPFAREQKIDGLAGGIHGPIQISFLPFDFDVYLVDPVTLVR
jgi:hypothetical protein